MDVTRLPSQNFRPRVYGVGAWTDHLAFACDLMATLRPRLFVELGTDRGESFFAFCQAAAENETGTRCFAVDTWRGDAQAGEYDETTWAEVSAHHAQHYAKSATLLRCTFDEARAHFDPESIDLLHLDGLHTEDAVRHDLESWLPKLAPSAILLLHDVCVRARDFGVWKVWEEMRTRGPSFTFPDGPGLGVWQKPPARTLPEPLASLMAAPNEQSQVLLAYYRAQARAVHERIAQHWRDGTIDRTAAGRQTIVQVFHTYDGVHREEDAVVTRVGHDAWKEVTIALPPGAGAAPLRIDFLSPLTIIELAAVRVSAGSAEIFAARTAADFALIQILGDATRLPAGEGLRLKITGLDPQLHLPPLPANESSSSPLRVSLRLRVLAGRS